MSSETSWRFERAELEAKLGIPQGVLGVLLEPEVFVLGMQVERAERKGSRCHVELYEPSMAASIEADLRHNARIYQSGIQRSGLDEFMPNTHIDDLIPKGLRPVSQVIGDLVIRIDPPR